MAASTDVNSPIASKLSAVSFHRSRKCPPKDVMQENGRNKVHNKKDSRKSDKATDGSFSCTPVVIEFRRLLKSPKNKSINVLPGISNRDLLHATVALYDNCLPDITPEVLYSTVCDKWASTVLLVRNIEDVVRDYKTPQSSDRLSDDNTLTGGSLSPESAPYGDLKSPYDDLYSIEYNQINGTLAASSFSRFSSGDFNLGDVNCNSRVLENANKEKEHVFKGTQQDRETVTVKHETDSTDQLAKNETKELGTIWKCEDKGNSSDGTKNGSIGEEGNLKLKEDLDGHEKRRQFGDVFSDTESDSSTSSDEEEEEDFSQGVELFLKMVKERREKRMEFLQKDSDITSYIGIESRLVGCATWEKSHVCPGEYTIQIDLLAVRKRYRKSGVGKYLIQRLKDPSMVGRYDTLVVYADHSAVDFFSGYGFSDDIVLNSKYSELADNWTNCTLMCYIPPFTGQTILLSSDESLDLKAMELELQKWTQKSREAYQAQFSCLVRFRHEVIALRALVSSQQDVITSLSNRFDALHAEKQDLEKRNLLQRVFALKAGIDLDGVEEIPDTGYHEWDDCEGGEEGANLDSSSIIQDLERRVRDMGAESDVEGDEEQIDWSVAEEFAFAMREDLLLGKNFSVTRTKKAQPTQHTLSLYSSWCKTLNDPSMKTKMYFCGSLLHPERIHSILENGFSSLDFTCGDYGMGLYFSQHPSTAAHFSALGKMILAEVAIGTPETLRQTDRTRAAASRGYDSVITQGRLPAPTKEILSSARTRQQEYVVFHPSQALPLYLLEYQTDT